MRVNKIAGTARAYVLILPRSFRVQQFRLPSAHVLTPCFAVKAIFFFETLDFFVQAVCHP
jgi:hypothetical protein